MCTTWTTTIKEVSEKIFLQKVIWKQLVNLMGKFIAKKNEFDQEV